MPRTIVTEDGSQIEVPTEEEIATLKESAAKVEEYKARVDKYESDPVEKNWRELRSSAEAEKAKARKLEEQLSAMGKKILEDGTLAESIKPISYEEIEDKARRAARSEMVGQQTRSLLAKYDDDKRKVVEHYLTKLTAGEEVTLDNIDKFVREAELIADPSTNFPKTTVVRGQPPILVGADGKRFSDTEAGQSVAKEIFGDISYTNQK